MIIQRFALIFVLFIVGMFLAKYSNLDIMASLLCYAQELPGLESRENETEISAEQRRAEELAWYREYKQATSELEQLTWYETFYPQNLLKYYQAHPYKIGFSVVCALLVYYRNVSPEIMYCAVVFAIWCTGSTVMWWGQRERLTRVEQLAKLEKELTASNINPTTLDSLYKDMHPNTYKLLLEVLQELANG